MSKRNIARLMQKLGSEKEAGLASEAILGTLGNVAFPPSIPIASLMAYITDTRTDKEQAEADKDTWKNLVPGVGLYNVLKRQGHMFEGDKWKGLQGDIKKAVEKTEFFNTDEGKSLRKKLKEEMAGKELEILQKKLAKR